MVGNVVEEACLVCSQPPPHCAESAVVLTWEACCNDQDDVGQLQDPYQQLVCDVTEVTTMVVPRDVVLSHLCRVGENCPCKGRDLAWPDAVGRQRHSSDAVAKTKENDMGRFFP